MGYNYLPGVQVSTNDGGLAIGSTPSAKPTVILGTAGAGQISTPYLVTDRAAAAAEFGLSGTLIKGMEEVQQGGCDNIVLFRVGARAASLSGIGTYQVDQGGGTYAADVNNIGFTIVFGQVTPTIANDYRVYYENGLLEVWYQGSQVYSNNQSNPIDTGDIAVTGAAAAGTALKDSVNGANANHFLRSIPLSNSLIATSTQTTVAQSGGTITAIAVATGGAGYASAPTVAISGGGGTGATATATLGSGGTAGQVISITVTAPGSGYNSNPTVTLSGGGFSTAATLGAVTKTTLVVASRNPASVLDLGDTGLGLTPSAVGFDPCKLYEALQDAYDLLEIMPVQQVFCPNIAVDTPNVAYYAAGALTTDANNPANGTALGWLKTSLDGNNNRVYQWAHKTADSAGNVVSAQTFTSAADRLLKNFNEVSFAYQLARFCAKQSRNQGGCIGFIGFNAPKNFKPSGLKSWIGTLPSYDSNLNFENQNLGNPVTAGSGLLGTALLVGTTTAKLNANCKEVATQSYRPAGLFETLDPTTNQMGDYDDAVVIDGNGYKTDIGAYIHCVADYALLSNSYATTYVSNLAGVTAGLCSVLDEKSALTNKALTAVSQIYRLSMPQMDNLVQAKINVLRFKGDNNPVVLLHDRTAALLTSDYTFLLRLRIKFLVSKVLFRQADNYIGTSSTDGLTMAALQTALDKDLQNLQKRGYLRGYNFTVTSTLASQRVGQMFINIVFSPANELVRISATVSAGVQ
jgi:hypothetical protein